jgi:hypothetical protein
MGIVLFKGKDCLEKPCLSLGNHGLILIKPWRNSKTKVGKRVSGEGWKCNDIDYPLR